MKVEQFEALAVPYLRGELEGIDKSSFEAAINENPELLKQLESLRETWQLFTLAPVPQTSQVMDNRFFELLEDKVQKTDKTKSAWSVTFRAAMGWLFKPQLAYGILLLAIGLMAGYVLKTNQLPQNVDSQVVSSKEAEELREKYVLTLLEQPSANKRLQGVNEVIKMDETTESITKALFVTLNKDSNVNVRLAAVESLSRYVENPEVRMGLITSITQQDSPIVQIALADLMVALQEKQSIKSMEALLQKPDIDTTVSKKIKESIDQII